MVNNNLRNNFMKVSRIRFYRFVELEGAHAAVHDTVSVAHLEPL